LQKQEGGNEKKVISIHTFYSNRLSGPAMQRRSPLISPCMIPVQVHIATYPSYLRISKVCIFVYLIYFYCSRGWLCLPLGSPPMFVVRAACMFAFTVVLLCFTGGESPVLAEKCCFCLWTVQIQGSALVQMFLIFLGFLLIFPISCHSNQALLQILILFPGSCRFLSSWTPPAKAVSSIG